MATIPPSPTARQVLSPGRNITGDASPAQGAKRLTLTIGSAIAASLAAVLTLVLPGALPSRDCSWFYAAVCVLLLAAYYFYSVAVVLSGASAGKRWEQSRPFRFTRFVAGTLLGALAVCLLLLGLTILAGAPNQPKWGVVAAVLAASYALTAVIISTLDFVRATSRPAP